MQDALTQLYALAQEIVRRLIVDIEERYELGAGWAREPVLRRPSIMREWEEIVAECIATTGGNDATRDRPTSAPGTPADDHTLASTVGLVDDPAVDVRPRDVADKADNAGVAGAHAVDAQTAPEAEDVLMHAECGEGRVQYEDMDFEGVEWGREKIATLDWEIANHNYWRRVASAVLKQAEQEDGR